MPNVFNNRIFIQIEILIQSRIQASTKPNNKENLLRELQKSVSKYFKTCLNSPIY